MAERAVVAGGLGHQPHLTGFDHQLAEAVVEGSLGGGPLIIRIEAEGYAAQMWWFEGELDADYSYPLHVRLMLERQA